MHKRYDVERSSGVRDRGCIHADTDGFADCNAASDRHRDREQIIRSRLRAAWERLPRRLSITKTHIGNFAQGQMGATYRVTVSNGPNAGADKRYCDGDRNGADGIDAGIDVWNWMDVRDAERRKRLYAKRCAGGWRKLHADHGDRECGCERDFTASKHGGCVGRWFGERECDRFHGNYKFDKFVHADRSDSGERDGNRDRQWNQLRKRLG